VAAAGPALPGRRRAAPGAGRPGAAARPGRAGGSGGDGAGQPAGLAGGRLRRRHGPVPVAGPVEGMSQRKRRPARADRLLLNPDLVRGAYSSSAKTVSWTGPEPWPLAETSRSTN